MEPMHKIQEERYFVSLGMTESNAGHFVTALGNAVAHADATNLRKIKETWLELWTRFLDLGRKLHEKKEEASGDASFRETAADATKDEPKVEEPEVRQPESEVRQPKVEVSDFLKVTGAEIAGIVDKAVEEAVEEEKEETKTEEAKTEETKEEDLSKTKTVGPNTFDNPP